MLQPHPHRAAIALGSNLGDSLATLTAACDRLQAHAQIELKQRSSFYQTKPVGPPQPDYINGCVVVKTALTAIALLDELLAIEQTFGRERLEHWGPRTLDLDLLLYDNDIINHPRLQVPHPRMAERGFVLVPLAEIAPDWLHPTQQRPIADLRADLQQALNCAEIKAL